MPVTFPRVPTVQPGDAVASSQHAALALALNARIRSGLGDAAFRVAFWWLSAFRQFRNPDASRNLWPPNAEFFEFYQGLPRDVDFPTADPGDPEGLNVASLVNLYVYGNESAGVDSEDDRLTNPEAGGLDVRECATAEEAWQLGKEQRGAIVPSSGRMAAPAFDAALEVFSLVSAGVTPHGKAYGGWQPTPAVLGDCGGATGNEIPATNYEIKFTRIDGTGTTTYPGTCPGNPGDVYQVLDFPLGYYVVKFSGAVDYLSKAVWIQGPYSGGSQLRKTHGGHVERIANRFAGEFRGSTQQFQDEVSNGAAWLGNAFDVRAFMRLPYYLAPSIALDAGADSLTPVYPVGGGNASPRSVVGQHVAAAGFWFSAAYAKADPGTILAFKDGDKTLALWTSTGEVASGVVTFSDGAHNLTVECVAGGGPVSYELAETLAYRPQIHDLFTVLRIAGARLDDGQGTDGSGLTEEAAADLWGSYAALGCIPRTRGEQFLQGSMATINRNAVFDAARRYSGVVRCIPRANITGYAVQEGKSIVWIQPQARGSSLVDLLAGITGAIRHEAPPGGFTNEWVGFFQFKGYNPSGSSLWKPDAYSDFFALSDRCVFYSSNQSLTLKTHFNAADPDLANLFLAPEVASGYRYATSQALGNNSLNRNAGEPMFRSCRLYEPPVEIESAVLDGAEVRLTFTGRLHHHHALAPSSIERDVSTWDIGDLTAEATDYRTDENALREYLYHVANGSHQCTAAPDVGNAAFGSGVYTIGDSPFGSCYPHLWLVKLIPSPYEDGNDSQQPDDVPVRADDLAVMEAYVRVMSEGCVDGTTSAAYGCATGVQSVFDFTFENLCFQAFGRTSFTTLPTLLTDAIGPEEVREDGPLGYGPLPTVRLAAETFNQFAEAINLMRRFRVMLPMRMEATQYRDAGPTRDAVGARYADGSVVDCTVLTSNGFAWSGDGGTQAASTFITGPNVQTSAAGTLTVAFTENLPASCNGPFLTVGTTGVEEAYTYTPTDPAARYALPEAWRDMIDVEGSTEMLAEVQDVRRVTTSTVGAGTGCVGTDWDTGAGLLTITVDDVTTTECRTVPAVGRAIAEPLGGVSLYSAVAGGNQCDATYTEGATTKTITPIPIDCLILSVPLE